MLRYLIFSSGKTDPEKKVIVSSMMTLWPDLNSHKSPFWRTGIQNIAVVPGLSSRHQGLELHAQGKGHHCPTRLLLSTAGTGWTQATVQHCGQKPEHDVLNLPSCHFLTGSLQTLESEGFATSPGQPTRHWRVRCQAHKMAFVLQGPEEDGEGLAAAQAGAQPRQWLQGLGMLLLKGNRPKHAAACQHWHGPLHSVGVQEPVQKCPHQYSSFRSGKGNRGQDLC